jgi:hypothetical protein
MSFYVYVEQILIATSVGLSFFVAYVAEHGVGVHQPKGGGKMTHWLMGKK